MENKKQKTGIEKAYSKKLIKVSSDSNIQAQVLSIGAHKWDQQVARAPNNSQFKFKLRGNLCLKYSRFEEKDSNIRIIFGLKNSGI